MATITTPGPAPLPRPSHHLPHVAPYIWKGSLWRIADRSDLTPRVHASPRYRFDAPRGEYSALYTCAQDIGTFAETYVERGRRLGLDDGRRCLLEIRPRSPLSRIDLHDIRVLAAWDIDERISIGDDYAVCQEWALAIHQRFADITGIRYRARKAGAAIANVFLYADRCAGLLDVASARRLEDIEDVVLRAADEYRLSVLFPFANGAPSPIAHNDPGSHRASD